MNVALSWPPPIVLYCSHPLGWSEMILPLWGEVRWMTRHWCQSIKLLLTFWWYWSNKHSDCQRHYPWALGPLVRKRGWCEHKHCDTTTVDVVTWMATEWLTRREHRQLDTLDKRSDGPWPWGFILLLRTVYNSKWWVVYCCIFSLAIFRPWWATGNWKYKSETSDKRGLLYSLGLVSLQLTPSSSKSIKPWCSRTFIMFNEFPCHLCSIVGSMYHPWVDGVRPSDIRKIVKSCLT